MYDGSLDDRPQEGWMRCGYDTVRLAAGCVLVPLVWGVLIPLTMVEAGVRMGHHVVGRWLHPYRNWPYLMLLVCWASVSSGAVVSKTEACRALCGDQVILWPTPTATPAPNDCLYLQHDSMASACTGGIYSHNITGCVIDQWGQCPQEGGDTLSGRLGQNLLAFRYSTIVPQENWGTGPYVVTSKITLWGRGKMSYRVRLSRMSSDCRVRYEELGEVGPFAGPVPGDLLAFHFPTVSSYRSSTTDRLVVDFIVSGDDWYSFGTSYGHAEHVGTPLTRCTWPPIPTP